MHFVSEHSWLPVGVFRLDGKFIGFVDAVKGGEDGGVLVVVRKTGGDEVVRNVVEAETVARFFARWKRDSAVEKQHDLALK